MKLMANNPWVVIKPETRVDRTPGGIHLPDTVKEKPRKGRVIACPPDDEKRLLNRVVYYREYAAQEFEHATGSMVGVKVDDIICVEV